MLDIHVVCHLWDLHDEGVEDVLDRLQGELGVTGVAVPVVCPATAVLRGHHGVSPRLFHTEGGAFFPSHEAYYQATRYRPAPASWLKSRDPLGRVVEGCRRRGLAFRAVVHAAEGGRLAARHPEAAAKSVFGDPWPNRICLLNPDVQALIIGMSRDLYDTYGPEAIELRDFHGGRPDSVAYTLDPACDVGTTGRALLAVCFCESCRQLGHTPRPPVDVAGAARAVEDRLMQILETGEVSATPLHELAEDDPPLAAYLAARRAALSGFLDRLSAEVGCDLILHEDDAAPPPDPEAPPLLPPDATPGVAAQAFRVPADVPIADLDLALATARARTTPPRRTEVVVPICPQPSSPSGERAALVRALIRAAEQGVGGVQLDCYGVIPSARMAIVKQAVRFARRTSGGEPV